ncbi:CaiB/BaiF CoA-transferase family protein [Aestuariibacter sp. A3R04]|uniref:CaiB/BaiF CoA transferase family protein n=1 Tax=Aestuariibacter sp. A3R04 TaxID=2841571 RepID=UPI001C08F7D5|nr:CaiB/BaiF CoA-transferase family protein [Aestuariibacter sp. A3R04]MBU3023521.1 CoA transferase [Aestuariibacter sp. A3R04]
MAGPLQGIKVLDLSRILAGPWSTQVLADYGAEVWKIERPQRGDDTRHWGPPYAKDKNGEPSEESAYYLSANRGKKSVTVDITTEAGQALIYQMVEEADILVENYKVGGLKKYGLDYTTVKQRNPAIIYCSITGFGQTGPYAQCAGYDAMIQAMGGLMSITGEKDGEPGAGPQKVGVAVVDLMTGMYAVSGILAALYHRVQTGEGQHIDLALLDTQVAWLANQGSNYLVSGELPKRMGTAHPNIVPYQAMKVKDGYILLAVGNDDQFSRCCDILGAPEIATQPEFATNAQRVAHRHSLIPLLEALLEEQPLDVWLEKFSAAHVPCGPINTLDRVFDNEQVKYRKMQFDLQHPTLGTVPQVGNPVRFSKTPVEYNSAPPLLGQHTVEIINRLTKVK